MADRRDTSMQQMTAPAPRLTKAINTGLRSGAMRRLVRTVKLKPMKVPLSTCIALSCRALSVTAAA